MASTFLSIFLFLLFFNYICGQSSSFKSTPDLQNIVYSVIDGQPCVRLLNLFGTIGCLNPRRDKIATPIVRFENLDKISEPFTILVSLDEFPTLFTRISDDSNFASKVRGVPVESRTDSQNKLYVSTLSKIYDKNEEVTLIEAIQVGAFQRLLLMLQIGCDKNTKEKATELLKLLNANRSRVEYVDSLLDFKYLKKRF